MATLGINFDTVPDVVQPVDAGIRLLKIEEAPTVQPNKDKTGNNLVVTLKVAEESATDFDRQITMFISMNQLTTIKRLFLASGITPTSTTSTEELVGKTLKAVVVHRVYTDKDTNDQKTGANIKDFIIPEQA